VEERPALGAAVTALKQKFEEAFAARREVLVLGSAGAHAPALDLTMPGRRRWTGGIHPTRRVIQDIVEIFRGLGFAVATGPEVEDEWYNFLALNFPPTTGDGSARYAVSSDAERPGHARPAAADSSCARTRPPSSCERCWLDLLHTG
jgi:phenylalanyl-tRNA synthetase alpha chain